MYKIGMRQESTFVRGEKCGVEYPCVGAQGVLVYDNVCGLCHCLGNSVFRMACRCAWVNRKRGCQDNYPWRHCYFLVNGRSGKRWGLHVGGGRRVYTPRNGFSLCGSNNLCFLRATFETCAECVIANFLNIILVFSAEAAENGPVGF